MKIKYNIWFVTILAVALFTACSDDIEVKSPNIEIFLSKDTISRFEVTKVSLKSNAEFNVIYKGEALSKYNPDSVSRGQVVEFGSREQRKSIVEVPIMYTVAGTYTITLVATNTNVGSKDSKTITKSVNIVVIDDITTIQDLQSINFRISGKKPFDQAAPYKYTISNNVILFKLDYRNNFDAVRFFVNLKSQNAKLSYIDTVTTSPNYGKEIDGTTTGENNIKLIERFPGQKIYVNPLNGSRKEYTIQFQKLDPSKNVGLSSVKFVDFNEIFLVRNDSINFALYKKINDKDTILPLPWGTKKVKLELKKESEQSSAKLVLYNVNTNKNDTVAYDKNTVIALANLKAIILTSESKTESFTYPVTVDNREPILPIMSNKDILVLKENDTTTLKFCSVVVTPPANGNNGIINIYGLKKIDFTRIQIIIPNMPLAKLTLGTSPIYTKPSEKFVVDLNLYNNKPTLLTFKALNDLTYKLEYDVNIQLYPGK